MSALEKITNLEITAISPYSNPSFDGVSIFWTANIGFGECNFYKAKGDDTWHVDTESMCSNEDKRFLKMLLEKIADMVEVTG